MKKAKKAVAAAKIPRQVQKHLSQKPFKSFYRMEPLPATFTLISILGMIITTVFTVSGRIELSWGVAFDLVFALMFIASMMSITPRFAGYD
ncbi:hypothetical protein HYU16_01915 [Candidatus Woesearchaeota archaeon]|nr:hypothetical protein [Candidatus Woesearchaeota archaeon]MBI2550184.1 hypothetical protein [Candidatus Woesearchaeota archaeon]